MSEFQTIFYEPAPDGQRVAIVEQDDRVAYLYLHAHETSSGRPAIANPKLKACWIRNLVNGPVAFDRSEMEQGIPPLLPRLNCAHAQGLDPLEEDRLSVTWFEDGTGVALYYDNRLEAIIPPWSGLEGFHGYARECRSANQVCWPLPNDGRLEERLDRASRFWKGWRSNKAWPHLQSDLLSTYERVLGRHSGYYAIDGNRWPPKAIVRFDLSDVIILVTAGVCIRPQPECDPEEPSLSANRRIELGIVLANPIEDSDLQNVLTLLSSVSNYPWYYERWLSPGDTYPFESAEASGQRDLFPRVLVTADPRLGCQFESFNYHGDEIRMLWMLPLYQRELDAMAQVGPLEIVNQFHARPAEGWKPNRASIV